MVTALLKPLKQLLDREQVLSKQQALTVIHRELLLTRHPYVYWVVTFPNKPQMCSHFLNFTLHFSAPISSTKA